MWSAQDGGKLLLVILYKLNAELQNENISIVLYFKTVIYICLFIRTNTRRSLVTLESPSPLSWVLDERSERIYLMTDTADILSCIN